MIPLIVLAAGQSKRFGRNKLLEKIDGSTIIERVVKNALSSKADEVIVVLGFEAHKVLNVLKKFNCKFVFNEEFYSGQSSSVKVGVKAVVEYAEAVIILPGDMALITPKPINMIINEYYESRSPIIVASYQGRLGHPALFDRSLFNEILAISEETMGLKAIVRRYRDKIKRVEVNSIEVLVDIDTPEDLEKILSNKN
ncbi:MAG: nucleotidyltransferase family protein [Candidatus Bathyarchaeia archaeon]|nr:nucleotidyltransferase family protein [Candidatus Bathyarchaeota archaeon]